MGFLLYITVVFATFHNTVTGKSHGEFGPIEVSSKVGYIYHKYQQSENDKAATDTVLKVIKYAKRFIHIGIGKIPSLDPYVKEKLNDVKLHSKTLNGTLRLSNFVVKSLSEGNLQNFQMYAAPSRVEFGIYVPSLIVTVHVDGLNIDTGSITFNISTDITLTLQKFRIAGSISIMPDPALDKYQATGLQTTALIEDIEYDSSTRVNGVPRSTSKLILKGIHKSVNAGLFEDLNTVLQNFSIQQMQRILQPNHYFLDF